MRLSIVWQRLKARLDARAEHRSSPPLWWLPIYARSAARLTHSSPRHWQHP